MRAFKSAGGMLRRARDGRDSLHRADVEHWHGATPDTEFTQGALTRGDAAGTAWLEQVSDEQYNGR